MLLSRVDLLIIASTVGFLVIILLLVSQTTIIVLINTIDYLLDIDVNVSTGFNIAAITKFSQKRTNVQFVSF